MIVQSLSQISDNQSFQIQFSKYGGVEYETLYEPNQFTFPTYIGLLTKGGSIKVRSISDSYNLYFPDIKINSKSLTHYRCTYGYNKNYPKINMNRVNNEINQKLDNGLVNNKYECFTNGIIPLGRDKAVLLMDSSNWRHMYDTFVFTVVDYTRNDVFDVVGRVEDSSDSINNKYTNWSPYVTIVFYDNFLNRYDKYTLRSSCNPIGPTDYAYLDGNAIWNLMGIIVTGGSEGV